MSPAQRRARRVRLLATTLGVMDLALGLVLLLGPPNRVSSPAFAAPKQVMPMPAWGAVLVVIALVLLIRLLLDKDAPIALTAGATWHAFFCSSLAESARINPAVAFTWVVIYAGVVAIHTLTAWRRTSLM